LVWFLFRIKTQSNGGLTMKQYTITCNEEQLRLIADAVEDWSRFLGGQCELNHATSLIADTDNYRKVQDILHDQVHPCITPQLPLNASYGWNGGTCPNEHQKKAIAMSYSIYRQILHFFAIQRKDNDWNVYKSPTLTCEEQGGLIQIKEIVE
jgi:hypothetical protein